MKGFFITFEGGEGSGKSTQLRLAISWMKSLKLPVYVSKEPGGTEIGVKIREILLNPDTKNLTHRSELLLYLADRAQHLQEVVIPRLKRGEIVVCDRFGDSSTVYQGICRKLGLKWVETLNHFATFGTEPNLTILFDVSEKVGTARIRQRLKEDVWLQGVKKRVKLDRIDSEKIEFHREVRKGFLKLAKMHSKRIQIVSGESEVSTVHEEVKALILKRMGRLPLWKKKLSKAI